MVSRDQLVSSLVNRSSSAPRLQWATVTAVSPSLVMVDGSGVSESVSAVAVAGLRVSDRALVARDDHGRLTVVSSPDPASRASLDTGWIPLTLVPGYSGLYSPAVRVVGGLAHWQGIIRRDAGPLTTAYYEIATFPSAWAPAVFRRQSISPTGTTSGVQLVVSIEADGRLRAAQAGPASTADVYLSALSPYPVN